MKKVLAIILALVLSLTLIGCGVLENEEKDYYVTGNFNGWDTVDTGMMTAIAKNDDRVASIKDELDGVEYLYIVEITLPAEAAGWGVNYIIDGVNTTLDGNLTVKVIRTTVDDSDARDWWAQNPESGEITNLTPATLFMPEFLETATTSETVDEVTFTSGSWNDNPAALAAGTYYAVFAEFDGSRALGLIEVE
ncbi:MAG: hypothetical protein KAU02_02065 [Tenericutes bacterium]|nr:hypothetical protein [Mycoplasmatota bacterium]